MKLNIVPKLGKNGVLAPILFSLEVQHPQCPIFIPYICYLKYWNSIKWWICSQVFQNSVSSGAHIGWINECNLNGHEMGNKGPN
jgi:hypothetical protein